MSSEPASAKPDSGAAREQFKHEWIATGREYDFVTKWRFGIVIQYETQECPHCGATRKEFIGEHSE
jgi:hypothetical protein